MSNLSDKNESQKSVKYAKSNSNQTDDYEPSKATSDYFKKHPLKNLNTKNMKSMQIWINQKVNENPSNMEYNVISLKFLKQLSFALSLILNKSSFTLSKYRIFYEFQSWFCGQKLRILPKKFSIL